MLERSMGTWGERLRLRKQLLVMGQYGEMILEL